MSRFTMYNSMRILENIKTRLPYIPENSTIEYLQPNGVKQYLKEAAILPCHCTCTNQEIEIAYILIN